MFWLYAFVIGLIVGMTIGWTAEQVRVAPLVQSLVAFFAAVSVGAVLVAVVWFLRAKASGGSGAIFVSMGTENVVYLVLLGTLVAGLHVGLGQLGAAPRLVQHRAMILSVLGGLCGTFSVAWWMAASTS
jgi:hypothetical protein